MLWNKTSIPVTASLNEIARKFDSEKHLTGSHHLRVKENKEGVPVLYEKHFSGTKLLAMMGHSEARKTIREQRQLARTLLTEKVNTEYDCTAEDIRLPDHAPLRGGEVKPMLAHAAVAAAAKQMGFDQVKLDPELKASLLQQARDHVYSKGSDISAAQRIQTAKNYLTQITVEHLLPSDFPNKAKTVGKLCEQFWAKLCLRDPDILVARVMLGLLRKNPETTLDELETAVLGARLREHQQSKAE